MTYGLGVPQSQRFTTILEQREPTTEHVNAGLPGTAPDSYFAVIEAWANRPIDTVVMHLYEGNDYAGLGSPSPCCRFEPILAMKDGAPALRCADPTAFDLSAVSLRALRLISPPPYLLRAMVPESHAAAALATAMVPRQVDGIVTPEMEADLDVIVATAAERLRATGRELVVVALADRYWVETPNASGRTADRMLESARRAGVPALDARPVFRAAHERGEALYLGPHDGHFNEAGHQLMAAWLSENLRGD